MSKEDIQDEQNDIKSQITELTQELDALNKSQDANKERATALQAQLDALNSELAVLNYINGLSSAQKMDINTFKTTLYQSILDTLKGLKYETTNSDGNKVVYTISDDTTLANFAKNLVYDNDSGNVNPAFIAYFLSKVDSSAGNLNIASGADVGQVYNQQNQNDATGKADTVSDLSSFINGLNATKTVYAKSGTDAQGHTIYSTTAQSTDVVTMDSSLANDAKTALSDIKTNDLTLQTVTQNGKTFNITSYSGKTIVDGTALDNINDAITSTQNEQAAIASAMDQATNNIASIAKKIGNAQSLYDNLENGNPGGTYKNGSYSFSNLNATGGTINIKSYNGSPSTVSGSGSLVVNVADILINNYSNYNLVFKDLTVGAGSSGVFIDGTGYSGSSAGTKIRDNNLRVFTNGNGDNAGSITINDYYDPTHPVNNSAIGNIASDIIINGTVNTNSGNINILNEGGNIAINNNTDAQKITIDVPQGDFTQNTKGQNYLLKNGDTLFAGGKIDITASTIEVDGTMKAGNADRNLTITDDMLSHLVADYVTGKNNLVNLDQGNKSVYMNGNNNIKAIYDSDTNTVTLFGVNIKDNSTIKLTTTEQAQASHPMKLDPFTKSICDALNIKIPMVGAVNPLQIGQNAKISSADGNGIINIINNTNKNIVVNGLNNNKVTGGVSYNDASNNSYDLISVITNRTGASQDILSHISNNAIASLAKTNAANENIMVDSTGISGTQSGDLTVNGAITSGNVSDGTSDLTLKTNGNLDINAKYENGNSGPQVPVINTSGTVLLSKTTSNGKVQISGLIKNSKGKITVNNAGNNGVILASTGEIDNTDGSVEINNTGETGINVAGKIDVSGDNSTVSLNNTNTGNSGITLAKDSQISNISQNNSDSVTLSNNGKNGIAADGNISSEKGGILLSSVAGTIDVQGDANIELNKNNTLDSSILKIENTAAAKGINVSGKVTNSGKGDIYITNNGSEDTTISTTGVVTSGENGGDINISKSQTGGITINGTVLNKKGNTSVISNGTSGISVVGNVTNKNGSTSITNNSAKGINIAATGTVANSNGDTTIENTQGTEGISILGRISNAIGNIFAKNSKGDIKIAQGAVVENNSNGLNSGNIALENKDGSNSVNIAGNVTNSGSGNTSITNNGATGIDISGNVTNKNGATTITNNTGTNGINVSGTVENANGLLTATNASGAVAISGAVKNSGGKLSVNNTGSGVNISGTVQNKTSGDVQITNSGADGIGLSGTVCNDNGSTLISNTGSKGVTIATTGAVTNSNGDTTLENTQGAEGISILGRISNAIGNIFAKNSKGDIKIAQGAVVENNSNGSNAGNISLENNDGSNSVNIAGNVTNSGSGNTSITNNGATGIDISGNVTNKNGTVLVSNVTGNDGINISGNVKNANNLVTIENTQGQNGINVSGSIENTNGATTIDNKNASNTSAVAFTTTAKVTNNNGKLTIKNVGTKTNGIVVNGLLKTVNNGDIEIDNQNSNIAIGENTSTNGIANSYISSATDTIINQTNGNIINTTTGSGSYYDSANPNNAYKTLIATGRNLQMNVTDGDIGEYTGAGDAGFSINSSTRNYTDSINVNVLGYIIANALNHNKSDLRLVNLRSRFSDMNVNSIKADGNVMLTASDWRQNDATSTSNSNYGSGNYFQGYSILNAKGNNASTNVEGENISLISSNDIGTSANDSLNIKQNINPSRKNVWVSFEAENNANVNDMSTGNSNLWQAVTKHGSMNIVLGGGENSIIKSVTSGDHLHLTKKGKNLTIYDLGISQDFANSFDDILFHHDLITLSGAINRAVPKSIQIEVLDANGGNTPNSTLNIYNAYVKGRDANDNTMSDIKIINTPQKAADVELRADNVIAHAYNSTNTSNVINYSPSYHSGFNPQEGRTYYDNPIAQTGAVHQATGFHSYGEGGNSGASITFDLRGVSPELVSYYTGNAATRTYYDQPITRTLYVFSNPMAISSSNYKMKEITLSYNNDSQATENRGMTIDRLYSDYGYVDTNDLNFTITDAIINHYGEFRNGDRNASSISPRNYRWRTVVDNDYRRLVDNTFGTYVTLQLYTALTGSFGLNMGDLIVMKTMAPAVNYNPYEVTNLPRNENSFYRLTYKDDKIQETTTTPSFKDVDKSTDNHIKRVSMRFNADNVSLNDQKDVKVYNISKTGMELDNFSHAKVGDTVKLDVKVDNINIKATAKVMRASSDGRIGVQFIDVDRATQNKILYLNLLSTK